MFLKDVFLGVHQSLKKTFILGTECLTNQINVSGQCQDCPAGQVPNSDGISCLACQPDETTNAGVCKKCTNSGEVPNLNQTDCIQCPTAQIAIYGHCKDCPSGLIPNFDQSGCIPCPDGQIPNDDHTTCIGMHFALFVTS